MSEQHPMLRWAERNEMTVPALASSVHCSEWHLRNIFAGRKEASLGLAKRLTEISGGEVPMDAFLRPAAVSVETTEART